MCLTWVVGVLGASSGCANVAYLAGWYRPPPETLDPGAIDAASQPLVHSSRVVEQARLRATADAHRVAFPLGIAKLLLGTLLVLASAAALAARPSARSLALQAVAASALLAALDHGLLGSVRDEVGRAVAADMVEHGFGQLPDMSREESVAFFRGIYGAAELLRLALLEIGVYGGALLALTRARTKAFFEAPAKTGTDAPQDR
ncbi:MAG: hypothetical protein HY744_28075 [Deltaproteobacteria bacterium]|nr:hypothetical protein [Deltaproteobacteria bacterium]